MDAIPPDEANVTAEVKLKKLNGHPAQPDSDKCVFEASAVEVELHLSTYPEVWLHGHLAPLKLKRGLALLAWLAESGRKGSRTQLAELLWPDAPINTGRTRLRRLCHEVGSALGIEALKGDADAIWLMHPQWAASSDLARIRSVAREMIKAPSHSDHRAALDLLCSPHANSVLDGFSIDSSTFDGWLAAHRTQHEQMVLRALRCSAKYLLEIGAPSLATVAAYALIRLEPYAEVGHALLLQAQSQLGDAGAVESAYFACADLLRNELGIRPSAHIESAYLQALARISAHQEGTSQPSPARMPPVLFAESVEGVIAYT